MKNRTQQKWLLSTRGKLIQLEEESVSPIKCRAAAAETERESRKRERWKLVEIQMDLFA